MPAARIVLLVTALAVSATAQNSPRIVDIKAAGGVTLKATYFPAAKPGPGALLLHQVNRTRTSWDDVAHRLAASGIHTLALDLRGFGDSGGAPYLKATGKERTAIRRQRPSDIDAALEFLASQPGVNSDVIGLAGAGYLGVATSVDTAASHLPQIKSLVLISGQVVLSGRQFLRRATQLPGLYVWADNDEYPPTAEVMEWMYGISTNPGKRFIHYSAAPAPWLGYEDDPIPATGAHGTDLFQPHPELAAAIVDWFVTTLIKTPGHAPPHTNQSAGSISIPLLDEIEKPGGTAHAAELLADARRKNPKAQLWPWVVLNVMGYDNLQTGHIKLALEIFKLNFTAYPQSADAASSLSDAYLADGQKELARQYAEKSLALLAADKTENEARRKVIRDSAEQNLKQLAAKEGN